MGSVPTTDAEGRRWHSAFNATKKEVPPFGTVFCSGKWFSGDWTERKLPNEKNQEIPKGWMDLQKDVGFGNLVLVISEAYSRFTIGTYAADMFYHNGPTAIPPGKWGRVTQDYPCVARIRVDDRARRRERTIGFFGYVFSPRKNSFDLVARINKWGGLDNGWGWWRWGGRSAAMFTAADHINGFNSNEGLAWVVPGVGFSGQLTYELALGTVESLKDGENDLPFRIDTVFGDTEFDADSYQSVYAKDGLLCFRSPGKFEIDLNIALSGSGGQAPDGENPWSQIRFELETEYAQDFDPGRITVRSNANVTLAPPVIKQGEYGQPSTYLTHYEYVRLQYAISIPEPKDFDPYADDRPDLVRLRMRATRSTNDPSGMSAVAVGQGTVVASGPATDVVGGMKSLLTPG